MEGGSLGSQQSFASCSHASEGLGSEAEEGSNSPGDEAAVIAGEFEGQPNASIEHFFVAPDSEDPAVAEDVVRLDAEVPRPESITHFLTLPSVTERPNPRRRLDPIINFTKSVMLTSDQYVEAAEHVKQARADVLKN